MIKKFRVSLLTLIMLTLAAVMSAWAAMSDEDFAGLCYDGSVHQIRSALLNGANPNTVIIFGETAFMRAAANNTPEVVSVLLKAGADVNAKDFADRTSLMWAAAENDNPEVISVLLNAGADVNVKTYDGETALMWAAAYKEKPEVVSVLLKAGADVNVKNDDGKTALMLAAEDNKNPEVISVLLNAGADINAKDNDGKTALDWAREGKNTDAIKLLEETLASL